MMNFPDGPGYYISKLTLGTVALGTDYGISNRQGKPTTDQAFEILTTAVDAGINAIDTANDYGNAEELLGEYMNEHSRDNINVVTKFRISTENLSDKQKAKKQAYESVETSLNRLKTDRIPICLFHKYKDTPMDLLMKTLPSVFEDMIGDGLIDVAGVSAYYPQELKTLCEESIFEAFQVPMNVFDHRLINTGILPRLQAENKIVFIRSIFLQGLFFMKPAELKGNLVKAGQYLNGLKDIADQERMSIAQLAFTFVRDTPGISSMVFGAVDVAQVKQNAELLESPSMSERARTQLTELVKGIPDDIIIPGLWSGQK